MKMIDVLHMPRSIWLGRKTEQNFRPIAFDVYKWLTDYPEATVSIVYTRPDGEVFPVASSDKSPIIWIPQQDVTTVSGEGEIELHLVGGGAVGISASTKTLIDDSAASAQPAAPSWVDQVVQDVTEQADRAEEAAGSIGGAIDEAVAEAVPHAVADYIEEHPIEVTETDPTVPAWAKQPTKPTYTAQEVGALPSSYTPPVTSVNGMTGDVVVETGGGGAVDSVNGKTGAVVLNASDVGALTPPFEIPITSYIEDGRKFYTTTVSVADFLANKDNCVFVFNRAKIPPMIVVENQATFSAGQYFPISQTVNYITIIVRVSGDRLQVTVEDGESTQLPTVTAADNGKSLVVENGVWGKGYQVARTPRVAMTAQDTTPTLDPNKLYVFPEMSALAITLATPTDNTIVNEYHFIFASGATPTTLTIPAAVKTPDGFTVDANMVYEVSILEGAMTAQSWAVSA